MYLSQSSILLCRPLFQTDDPLLGGLARRILLGFVPGRNEARLRGPSRINFTQDSRYT